MITRDLPVKIHVHKNGEHDDWFLPITISSENDIELGYVYLMVISAAVDRPHFEQLTLMKSAPKTEELISSGIATYRDSRISRQVHKDLASGKCKRIILDYSKEGFYDIDWDYVITILGVQPEKLIWLTSIWNPEILNKESKVTVAYHNFWEHFIYSKTLIFDENVIKLGGGFEQQIKDIENLKIRKYHGLSYARQPHIHRAYILSKMKDADLLGKTSYSWGGNYPGADGHLMPTWRPRGHWNDPVGTFEFAKHQGYLIEDERDTFMSVMNMPEKCFPDEELKTNKAHSINFDHIKDSYFQIINETFVFNSNIIGSKEGDPFLSEKSFKPFASGQPFIMWGQQNTIKALREMDYETFDFWINHDSYDSISDPALRLRAVVREIERLYAIPPQEWSLLLKEMLPAIRFNRLHLQSENTRTYNFKNDQKN